MTQHVSLTKPKQPPNNAVILDAEQGQVMARLQALAQTRSSINYRWRWPWSMRAKQSQSVYIWGAVGRGKTFLMDRFFESLNFKSKLRIHFHRFMRDTHAGLNQRSQQTNPLEKIAKTLAKRYRVICLDEFLVEDIADAMILGQLLEQLIAHQVVLVTTSNLPPSELYRDGLQRSRFLPTIALIEKQFDVLHLSGDTDYRLRWLSEHSSYLTPINDETEQTLEQFFNVLCTAHECTNASLLINGRMLSVRKRNFSGVWLVFDALCREPRSTNDYLQLAEDFPTVLINNVPILNEQDNDAAKRFIRLIDTLYDHHTKLVIAAASSPAELYRGQRLQAEFARTASRLLEMTKPDYWHQAHRGTLSD